MAGGGEYEPHDSRRVVGTRGDTRSWREQEDARKGRGEYEPNDIRNVTGTAATPDRRWTNRDGKTPAASGRAPEPDEEAG